MSYRPDSQSVETPARKIIEGIEEFESAVMERIRSHDWKDSHIDELKKLNLQLQLLKMDLATLAEDNW